MMFGTTNIKFIDAQQAKLAYQYKNTKRKLYKTKAAIWYNKTCRQKRLSPKYINTRINGNNQQCQRTHKAAILFRINQEIKYLYTKKQKLNEKLRLRVKPLRRIKTQLLHLVGLISLL